MEIPLAAQRSDSALEHLLTRRRTTRTFDSAPLTLDQLGALLWAAQGELPGDRRVAPSAHALFPLRLTVISGELDGLAAGVYDYRSARHSLLPLTSGDQRERIARTSLVDAEWLGTAAVILVLSADFVAAKEHFADQPPLGERGVRYVWLEAGHVSQNIYLRATELGLAAALVGGFDDERLRALDMLPTGHEPLTLHGIGT